LIVAEYSSKQIRHALANNGVGLRVGPLKIKIQSTLPAMLDGICSLYSDYSVDLHGEFFDFHIRVFTPAGLRRWIRPQVFFSNDDFVPFKPLPVSQAFAFFEWGVNWCVSQYIHNHLILHAAVVEKEGRAVIMPAAPGSGKSTLCSALILRGWRLLSDEMAMVRLSDGLITPIPRPVSLKNESIPLLQNFSPGSFISRPTFDTAKGTVAHLKPPTDSVAAADTVVKPAWIIAPKYIPAATAILQPSTKGKTMLMAVQNSFNYSVLGSRGFDALVSLVDCCQCYHYSYSSLDDAVSTFQTLQ